MGTRYVALLAFFGLVALIAGCGGGRDTSTGYVDPYEEEMSGSRTPPPPRAGSGTPGEPAGDATGDGTYGERKFVGEGRPGDELSKADFESMKKIGQDYQEARKLYQDYFAAKESGKEDKSSLERAISLYDQLMSRLEEMQKSHPNSQMVEEYFSNVSQERRNLLLER